MADPNASQPVSDAAKAAYAHVRVGSCDIAIPVAQVWQALPWQSLSAFPQRSGPLLGTVDAMDTAVPVVALERWLPISPVASAESEESSARQRLLVLRHDGALVGIRVDAVLGMKSVPRGLVRRLQHVPDETELFESVVPATAHDPALCILEVARLMKLSQIWCAEAELATANSAASALVEQAKKTHRYAVFQIGSEVWAVPVQAVEQVVAVPPIELALGYREHSWAISQFQGRKLPLVDVSTAREVSNSHDAHLMALISQGPVCLGLTVTACKQFIDLADKDIASTPNDPLRIGVVIHADLGKLQILEPTKLFKAVPLSGISQREAGAPVASSVVSRTDTLEPTPYLVFEVDQRYASPVEGIVGVVELTQQAKDDLRQNQSAALLWRDRTITVVNLPAITKQFEVEDPSLAVLVQPADATAPPVGIAIQSLSDWLPAHTARRSGMRMNAMGELSMIETRSAAGVSTSLVVVDLAQMAYLLG